MKGKNKSLININSLSLNLQDDIDKIRSEDETLFDKFMSNPPARKKKIILTKAKT